MRTSHTGMTAAVLAFHLVLAGALAAQDSDSDPRIGTWENQNNPNNVMTYEALPEGGMKVTVENLNNSSSWGYTTMLDGEFSTMTGSTGREEAAVTVIDEYVNEILYKTGGEITEVLTNVISPDGNTLWVTFRTPEGVQTNVAIYRKVQ